VHDAFQFAVLWTLALGLVGAVPLTTVLLYAARRGGMSPGERRARELRRLLLEEELYGGERCVECLASVEPDWIRCPVCTGQLRTRCEGCGVLLKLHWSACPVCPAETAVHEDVRAAAA
jgi:RNA polymerase subunit RPABC4/transcription elongation factor Spt4